MNHRKAIQIIIPDACHEKWEEMSVREGGRHCMHCQKTVIDFTGYSDKALHEFFTRHKNEKICGRFASTQLNREIQLPYQPHSRLYRIAVALGWVLSFSQVPDVQARWNVPFVMENSLLDMEKVDDGENLDRDSLVVKGRVVDERNEPVIGVVVEVSENGIVIGGAATDFDGLFKIELKEKFDSVVMRMRYIGYKEVVRTLQQSDFNKFQEMKIEVDKNSVDNKYIIMGYTVPLIKK